MGEAVGKQKISGTEHGQVRETRKETGKEQRREDNGRQEDRKGRQPVGMRTQDEAAWRVIPA